jgi:CRISPR-associated protein Csm4
MALYRLTLRLTAPLGTPLAGPTLFGQICWLRREAEGEAALVAWLADPARLWRVSDGFPAGFLPRPLTHPRPVRPEAFDRLKALKRRSLVTRAAWDRLRGGWSDEALAEDETAADPALPRRLAHNHVDRGGQGTQETGGLFFLDEDWRFARDGTRDIDLYVETAEPLAAVEALVADLGRRGYGRDAGTGRGRWTVVAAAEDAALADPPGPRRMSLSRGVLDPATMHDALWRLEPHFGRLGPQLALAGVSPFKRPVLLTRPGATFTPAGPGPWGRVLRDVHPERPEVVFNALHLAIPFAEAAPAAAAA